MSDAGDADARLGRALEGWRATGGGRTEVLAALPGARVFAGITATSTGEHVDAGTGLRAESGADMALVTLEHDGERALPVFTSVGALQRWRLDARPVAVPGGQVAAAALEQGAGTLLVDLDLVVTGRELEDLAAGFVPVAGSSLAARLADGGTTRAFRAPAVRPPALLLRHLSRALRGEPSVAAARLLDGPDGPVLGIVPTRPLAAGEQAELAHRLVVRLGPALPPEGLDLAVVPPDGPGHPVPRRWSAVLRPRR